MIIANEDKKRSGIRSYFEQEVGDYYKPVREGDFRSKNYIKYESYGGENKTSQIKEHLIETKPYLKDTINNLKEV